MNKQILTLITFIFLFSVPVYAEKNADDSAVDLPKVGETFPEITLEDQFGDEQTIRNTDRLVIVSFERDVSEQVHSYLERQAEDFLVVNNARYISDISAMPGIITSLFALPKMRDYKYSLMLNRDEAMKHACHLREGKLTVYHLNAGIIERIEFIPASSVGNLFSN